MIGSSDIKLCGKALSKIVFGTHKFGGSVSEKDCIKLLDTYVSGGGNFIDTARAYQNGDSEKCVGKWLKSNGCRENIILCTKCGQQEFENGKFSRHRINSADIEMDLFESLEALKTDYIDIYFVHKDDPAVPAGEVIEMLNKYVRQGIIRHIGASNWTAKRIAEGNSYAEKHGVCGFEFSQLAFSLYYGTTLGWGENELALEMSADDYKWYKENRLPVIGYNSQAYGFFYKNFNKEDNEISASKENLNTLKRLREICSKRNLSPHQALFGCYFGCDIINFPLVTASSNEHLTEIINNCDVALDNSESQYLFGEWNLR